jgi:hypothetical protein
LTLLRPPSFFQEAAVVFCLLAAVGAAVGLAVRAAEGLAVGAAVGLAVRAAEGLAVGAAVGLAVRAAEGLAEGAAVGLAVRAAEGLAVGDLACRSGSRNRSSCSSSRGSPRRISRGSSSRTGSVERPCERQ